MTLEYFNNGITALLNPVEIGDESFTVVVGGGSRIPLSSGKYAFVRLGSNDPDDNEDIKITGRTGDVYTCEGFTRNWPAGTLVTAPVCVRLLDEFKRADDLGTAAESDVADFASAAQGAKADTAVQPAVLAALAPLASPALTGTPTAPTPSTSDNSNKLATTAFVQALFAALVNSAPGALDTLNELAAALGDDPNFATTVLNALAGKLGFGGGTMSGNINLAGFQIQNARLTSVRETAVSVFISSGAITLDLSAGNVFFVTLTENITSITPTNVPASGSVPITIEFVQDGTGGRTVAGWPAAVKWPGGIAPTITATANAVDIISGYTRNGGTTYRFARAHADSK